MDECTEGELSEPQRLSCRARIPQAVYCRTKVEVLCQGGLARLVHYHRGQPSPTSRGEYTSRGQADVRAVSSVCAAAVVGRLSGAWQSVRQGERQTAAGRVELDASEDMHGARKWGKRRKGRTTCHAYQETHEYTDNIIQGTSLSRKQVCPMWPTPTVGPGTPLHDRQPFSRRPTPYQIGRRCTSGSEGYLQVYRGQ